MSDNPLQSLNDYSAFVAELLDRASVIRSTVAVWSESPYMGDHLSLEKLLNVAYISRSVFPPIIALTRRKSILRLLARPHPVI
jgi:hypothetical protein